MYVRHFLKMLVGLVVMGAIGVAGLVVANYYSKVQEQALERPAPTAPAPASFHGTVTLQPMAPAKK